MRQIRGETPGEAFDTLDPFALVGPDDLWHCDLESKFEPARYGFGAQLARRLRTRRTGPDFVKVGVVGHKGTGKTTQVRKVMADLRQERIYPVFVDALTSLDQASLSFSDIILLLANSVVNGLSHANAEVPRDEFELPKAWFTEELLTETHRSEILGKLQAEASASAGIPFLAKLTAKLTAVLKSDNEYRQEIRRRAERDPVDLLRRANQLLDAGSIALEDQKIAIVVDNLEKLGDRKQVDAAVLRRGEDLRQLRCHLVLFFDPADQYAPITTQASQAFDVVTVPMLPVRQRGDRPDHVAAGALAAIRELLDRRVHVERVFEPADACVRDIARVSGGRLRDVLHVARLACELADPERVTPAHIESAARKLRGERLTLVRPNDWPRLAEIHRDKQVASDPTDAHLLLHGILLNYDGDAWWDVHPLVRLDQRFQTAWQSLSRIESGPRQP